MTLPLPWEIINEWVHEASYLYWSRVEVLFFVVKFVVGGKKTVAFHLRGRFMLTSYLAETSACLKFEFKPFS